MGRFDRLLLPLASVFFFGLFGLAVVIRATFPPEATNLCGAICEPAYLVYPGSPDASPYLVVNQPPIPPEFVGIPLCNESPRGNG